MKENIIKLSRDPLIYMGKRVASDKGINMLRKPNTKMLWQVTMPKSGSTWLASVLGKGLTERGWHVSDLVPHYGNREQEIDPRALLLKGDLDKSNFLQYQHCLYSDYALKFIQTFDVKLIVQVRNIFDCLVSAADYIEKAYLQVPVAFISYEEWMKLTQEQKLHYIIDFVAPWYFRFWAGWSSVLNNPDVNVKLIKYEDMLADAESVFHDTFDFAGEKVNKEELSNWATSLKKERVDTKKNKGISGRGEDMPEHLKEQVYRLASYYSDTDFSPIGL